MQKYYFIEGDTSISVGFFASKISTNGSRILLKKTECEYKTDKKVWEVFAGLTQPSIYYLQLRCLNSNSNFYDDDVTYLQHSSLFNAHYL